MAEHDQGPLWSHAGGELAGDQKLAVETHLAGCAECRAALERAQLSRKILARASGGPGPTVAWGPLDRKLRAAAGRQLAGRSQRLWSQLSFGVAGLALAAVLVMLLRPSPPLPVELAELQPSVIAPLVVPPVIEDDSERSVVETAVGVRSATTDRPDAALAVGEKLRAGSVLKTPAGGRAILALPDGSRVKLTGNTEAALLTTRAEAIDVLVRRGTVLVKASHTARREFVVHAGALAVRVVGTAFSVTAQEDAVDVAVVEGKVLVEQPAGEARFLVAGEALRVEPKATKLRLVVPSDRDGFSELGVELTSAPSKKLRGPRAETVAVAKEPERAAPTPNPTPVVEAPPAPTVAAARPLPKTMEEVLLVQAEQSLKAGSCQDYMARLEETLDESELPAAREKARYLRARCFEEQVLPAQADGEYRKYLRDFPAGEHAAEARRAVAH